MKKLFLAFVGFVACVTASAMLTLKITVDNATVFFKVTQKELIDDSIYLYGTNKYNIKKIKVDNDTITLFTDNKTIKYGYNNPDLQNVLKERVLY